jgi:type VI secretion system protein ImpI
MQSALARLLDEIDPAMIEEKVVPSPFSPRKARAWDLLLRRWASLNEGENGMLDAFLGYFAEAYDKETRRK